MKVEYRKDESQAYQTITLEIKTEQDYLFNLLGTTNGIKQWFPELSFEEEKEGSRLKFDLGNDEYEYAEITDYTANKHIAYTWDVGHVDFSIEDRGNSVLLTFNEKMPFTFENIPNDFTGWYFQLQNVKKLAEENQLLSEDEFNFEEKSKEVEEQLNL